MLRAMLKSKIHGATVTQTELYYQGSITLPPDLMKAADMFDGERVDVVNLDNGERLSTYVIEGEPESRTICLNGPAARRAMVGDQIHVLCYGFFDGDEALSLEPNIVHVDDENRLVHPE